MSIVKEHCLSIFVLLAWFSFKGPAFSQDTAHLTTPDTLTSPSLAEVVVSAGRFSTQIRNTSEAINVLKYNALKRSKIRSLPESLTLTPGVFVQKTNHGGGSPFLRGLTGNQTLLLTDGIRLSNSIMRYGPNQYLNTIDIFSIEKTEILRGSGSVQYGSDAIGGTIQSFTNEAETTLKPALENRIITRLATHGMEKSFNLNTRYSNKNSAFRGGITYRNFGDIVGGDTTGRQTPTGYSEFDYDIKGKLLLLKHSSVTFVFQNVHQMNIPVYHKMALENYQVNKTNPQKRQLAYVRFNRELNRGILKSVEVTGSFQHSEEGREMMKRGAVTTRKENDRVKTYGLAGEFLFSGAGTWNGNLGAEVYSDLVNSSRSDIDLQTGETIQKRGLYPDGSVMTSAALFTLHTWESGGWNLSAGARFNAYSIVVKDENTGSTKLKPSALVGNLGIMRILSDASRLFISLNTGFRAPNIDDLGTLGIVDFRYETPNLDLRPERSFQYELGYRFYSRSLKGDIFIYRNELYDLITRKRTENQSVDGYPLYQKTNSDRAYIQGIETSWDLMAGRSVYINGSLTYTFGQNITNSEPLRRIPPLFGRLSADYSPDPFRFGIDWLAADRQERLAQGDIDDNRIPDGGTPGWNILNINAGYVWKIVDIEICLNNIFNSDYRYHGSGINGSGRSAVFTLQVTF